MTTTSVSPKSGSSKVKAAYGLGFRFSVNIDAMPLGRWQSCSGLKVSFKNTEIRKGGDYTSVDWLPDRIAYSNIVLKRAADAASSAKVQAWLESSALHWMEGHPSSGSGVTITLLDTNRKPVLTWALKDARPAAWSVSDLDAMSSKLAIETLELAHKGFEVRVGGIAGPPPPSAAPAPGGAVNPTAAEFKLSGVGGQVKFFFPPEKVVLVRNQDDRSANQVVQLNQGDGVSALQNKPGVTSYKMDNLVLDGPSTGQDVKLLLQWATEVSNQRPTLGSHRPPPGKPASEGWTKATPSQAPAKSEEKSEEKPKKKGKTGGEKKLPTIQFTWGTQFNAKVQLVGLTANYTRFAPDGKPLRATVSFTLDVIADQAANGAGNPTSGGIPGRGTHRLLATDSLQLVAREHYDSPGAWRDIARANDIDDPMRVVPGRLLYLPAFSELTEVGERR